MHRSGIALLLLLPVAVFARQEPAVTCKPCGAWQLDAAASEPVDRVLDAALAKYKPPKPKRFRPNFGDVRSETEAEFNNSLEDRPGPGDRHRLREDVQRQLATPTELTLRLDGEDIVIELAGNLRRRFTPGEPHARVDALGTAEIVTTLRGPTLSIAEKYSVRKTQNRETYTVDAGKGLLLVTRSVSRPGLPDVVVHSTYRAR